MESLKNKTKTELIAEIAKLQQQVKKLEAIQHPVMAGEETLFTEVPARQDSEERFRSLAENAPVLLRTTDTEGNFTFFSKQWLNFTGRTHQQSENNGWLADIHPQDLEDVILQLDKALRKKRKFEITYRLRKKTGDFAWVLETGTPFANDEGEFQGYITSVIDITEQRASEEIRQQEQIFRDTEDKFHEAIANISLCGISIRRDGTITFINKFMLKMTGYTESEVLGKNFFDVFVRPEEREMRRMDFDNALQNQGLLSSVERSVLAKDGSYRYILFRSFILNNHLGEISAITRIGEDVTERKDVEKTLSRTYAQLQDLFDNAHDLIQIFSLKGDIIFVNKAWKSILGYNDDEITRLNIVDLVHPNFRRDTLRTLKRILKGENIPVVETVFVSKEGKEIFLEGSVTTRYENSQPTAFRCILHDITDRLRAEKARQLYYRIGALVNQSTSLDELYHHIHAELGKIIDAENFYITLYSQEDDYLLFPYYVDEEFFDDIRITQRRFSKGLIEYGLSQQKSMILYEPDIQGLVRTGQVEVFNMMPKVWLGVPLKIDNRIIGFISLRSYKSSQTYTEKDLELLDFISGQIALAIERKQYEERLSKQTAKLNAIFESGKHLMWSVNHRLLLTSFNNSYADFVEKNFDIRPDIEANNLDKVRTRMSEDKYYWMWDGKYQHAFEGISQYFEVKTRDRDNPRKVTWWEVFLNPIFLSDGNIEEVSAIAHDITQKKNAEIGLRESEEKFRDIFESFQDIYFRSDLEGNISMISPSVYDELGYRPEEVIGSKTELFISDKIIRKNAMRMLLKTGTLRNYETNLHARDGDIIPFLFNIRLISNADGKPIEIEGVARDILDIKLSEEELRHAKELAEKSLKVKESFLANMSHEIRTPMNGIIGMIDLLTTEKLTEQQQDYVQTIKKSSETLLTILNDILDLSKIEAGKMSLNKSPMALSDAVEKLYSLFLQQAVAKNNKMTYKIQPDVPKYIIGDETRLLQVLSNFTSNAIKFTENGKILIFVSVIKQQGNRYTIKVEVVDTGIGIAKEKYQLLFNSFSQVDTSSSKSYGGTGLGLAISKALVALMNGEVGVDSMQGKGSTFWFTFEAESTQVNPAILPIREDIFKTEDNHFGNKIPFILLTDDNPVNRKVASEILKKSGCEVDLASSGEEAIQKLFTKYQNHEKIYDMIFMDIQMPDMDGVETTRYIREQHLPALPPIIAMTAYAMKEDRERFLQAGMDDYLPKPIKANILVQKVKEWMMRNVQEVAALTEHEMSEPIVLEEIVLPQHNQHLIPETIMVGDLPVKEEVFPVINGEIIAQLKKYAGEDGVRAILEEFAEEATGFIQESIKAFEKGDSKVILSNLHTLKGNSGTMGVEKLSHQAMVTEKKLKHNPDEDVSRDLMILKEYFEEFVKALENLQI
jgi:PAS domain S-box-containing protein